MVISYQDFVALARELLDDAHVAGMEETAASQPCRIDEGNRVEHQRVALPVSNRVSKIRRLSRLVRIVFTAVDRDIAELPVSAAVIGILAIEEGDVLTGLDNPRWVPDAEFPSADMS